MFWKKTEFSNSQNFCKKVWKTHSDSKTDLKVQLKVWNAGTYFLSLRFISVIDVLVSFENIYIAVIFNLKYN